MDSYESFAQKDIPCTNNRKSRRLGLSSEERKGLSQIVLPSDVYKSLCLFSENSPLEVSGALCGFIKSTELFITSWHTCRNVANSATECMIDIDELLVLSLQYQKSGSRLVGAFHSHANQEPIPSWVDCYFLKYSPFIWAISGYSQQQQATTVKYFISSNGCVRELSYRIP